MTSHRIYARICALVIVCLGLAGSVSAVTLGTPPAAGLLIEEVAVAETSQEIVHDLYPVSGGEYRYALPVPVFSSTGQPADMQQCLWSVGVTDLQYTFDGPELQNQNLTVEIEYGISGSYLELLVDSDYLGRMPTRITVDITAFAFKTTAPVSAETTTIGRVKEIYR